MVIDRIYCNIFILVMGQGGINGRGSHARGV